MDKTLISTSCEGKNLIKNGRFQMTQYIEYPMEKAYLAYAKVIGIYLIISHKAD